MEEKLLACGKALAGALFDLLYPDRVRCLCCGRALGQEEDGVCPACVQALEALEIGRQGDGLAMPLPPGIDYALFAYPYMAQARALILRLKFGHVRAAAIPLAKAMATLPGGEAELLVPVPTTKRRERMRGFNHAKLLCEHIARETGMPMADALTRRDDRAAQSGLSGQSRRRNIAGQMRAGDIVRGRRVLLIDDVYTTGATAAEAARALRAAEAVGVGVFAAAHSLYDAGEKKPASGGPGGKTEV